MSIKNNLRLDEEFLAGWNAHDTERTVSILSDDAVWHDAASPEPMRDMSSIRSHIQRWFTAFPDMTATVKNRVVTENQVAAELEFRGTNSGPLQMAPDAPAIPATGRRVIGRGAYFARFRDGKAVEVHTYPDRVGLMTQLGLMPLK